MRLMLFIGVVLLAGCTCKPAPAPAPPPPLVVPAGPTRGEIAGVHYLEQMTGGARPDERVPMIVVLHPMGGDPEGMVEMFGGYQGRARLLFPYGHPSGGMYLWLDSARDDLPAPMVLQETDRIAAAIQTLVAARPTQGKPIVAGFSQGGSMAFALAVTHPTDLAAVFPISGLLQKALYPSRALDPATLPPVLAFHGADDLAVPTQSARDAIAELRRAGYTAELREYPGVEHSTNGREMAEIFEQLRQAADTAAARRVAP